MKKVSAVIFSIILLITSCKAERGGSGAGEPPVSSGTESGLKFWFPETSETGRAPAETTLEELYSKAKSVFGGVDAENAKLRLFFDGSGECEVLDKGVASDKQIADLTGEVALASRYVEICFDSRFSDGMGVSAASAESLSDIPENMPDSYNFTDGFFDGDLSVIDTYPELEKGVSLAEYEYGNMTGCIDQLNEYAKAGAQTAYSVMRKEDDYFNTAYTEYYGTAHTVLCSDENGSWSINGKYNNEILTNECTEKIIAAFNKSDILSKAADCTVQLMFYMEKFVGASANYSADEKYYATYDVSFWESYKAPYEESYHNKSFLCWSGTDGCLKSQSGRLCPVGTYCVETKAPLGVYVPLSVMGDWKIVRVGNMSFEEYAAEVSDGYTDYSEIVCSISESRLFLYGGDLSVSLYDVVSSENGLEVQYQTLKAGSIEINGDGTLTLYIRHPFTENNMSLPLVLERYTPEITDQSEYTPAKPVKRPSSEEFAAMDTEKYGLLDLTGERVMGREIENPHVLSEYRKYAAEGGAYTIEVYTAGADRLEYELCTFDGKNGYKRQERTLHDENDRATGWEIILYDDSEYSSYYKLERYDLRKFERRDRENAVNPYTDLLTDLHEDKPLNFVKAYMITIGGVEYVCEEWKSDAAVSGFSVYSIDGVIKGYEGSFYGMPVVSTVTRFERKADDSLIRIPDKVKEVNYGYED